MGECSKCKSGRDDGAEIPTAWDALKMEGEGAGARAGALEALPRAANKSGSLGTLLISFLCQCSASCGFLFFYYDFFFGRSQGQVSPKISNIGSFPLGEHFV